MAASNLTWGAGSPTSIAITDTNPHNSDKTHLAEINRLTFQCVSTLNQAVTVTFQGSMDGTNWTNLPNPVAVSASSTGVATLSDPWIFVRASATCSVAPGSGTLVIQFTQRRVDA